ncbi:hypothetical protein [Methyloceanibacter caenitepidi]|uniref:Uncharacterized protein n=1 Tax=Methyloceanibacter caenitepidi TaxID=1384459 RepID=A0A0A8K619_9HYPH|nr:hypothetical protein [Methyloceanibacter caenitepidi]BAQ17439.1 hypothetical protein GL4_1990 [Methyloceanibacter caenitepidi]
MNVCTTTSEFEGRPLNADEFARRIWQRYIEANVEYMRLNDAHEDARCGTSEEIRELECPWTPDSAGHMECIQFEKTENHLLYELDRVDPVKCEDGIWLVREFRISSSEAAAIFRSAKRSIKCPRRPGGLSEDMLRWQPYPDANSEQDALDTSKRLAEKEWRSWKRRVSAIRRKYRAEALEQELLCWFDEQVCGLAQQIANMDVTGAASRAVKLALYSAIEGRYDMEAIEATESDTIDDIELAAIGSVYREAAAAAGFDPIAEFRANA